jgi:DNA mismatch repair protein MutS
MSTLSRPHVQSEDPPAEPERFESILFPDGEHELGEEPPFFLDLNLGQVVAAVVAGRDEYDLDSYFHTPLLDVEAVEYRHQVFRDVERPEIRVSVKAFAAEMRQVRLYLTLARTQHWRPEQQRWFLDAALAYCHAVGELTQALRRVELGSAGFERLRAYLDEYAGSAGFSVLRADARDVFEGLARLRYSIRIKGARVTVSTYEGEPDYSAEIKEIFARFRQGEAGSHLVEVPDAGSMDHVEARIVELVARIFPDEFRALAEFRAGHAGFVDDRLARFDREVQFYLAYLERCDALGTNGLQFSYPTFSTAAVAVEGGFDIALAGKLAGEQPLVLNDFALSPPERILVVTGPNQGGKTTFARMVGQLHYLAALGVPVPARSARLALADRLFTHFERVEDVSTLRGKLDDELVRVREILDEATCESIVILNEVFGSTTLSDARQLGGAVLARIAELGCLAVCVTFVDELASLGPATVSMVAAVDPADPSRRTFEVVRRPADGRAYAWALAEKYGLSMGQLRRRIGR